MRAGAAAIKAAIIDLDGTMLDTVPDFEAALNGMRADLGLAPITQATIKPLVGKGSEKLVRDALLLDWDAARVDAVFDEALAGYQRHYLAINGDHSTLFEGVIEGLQAMRAQGLRLVCVTNKPIAFTLPLLDQKGLAPYFERVFGGDSFEKKKPDPMPMLGACAALDLPPSTVVAIGDSSNDAESARAAGCFVLTVPYGYNHGRPIQEINSDGIVSSLLEAAEQISAHNHTAK
ncbi:phosphoglycolate phosphatase [Massilia varians]|jgi:phosphoglycolate phosphatase|uniref:phosphoglycolate phosphatase n=1 Tax=Massilia sp. LC238 TaxID=1502852 RepID=UPI0004E3B040|nr:phosphoglycolate phosphatase [Massilia sp. LC238]KFC76592.1 Phosphoglycolate phosphatase, bacterial [Massilia sp. LC238]